MHHRSQAGITLCKYSNGEVQRRPKGRPGERPSRFRRSQDVSHKWNLSALRGSKDSQDLIKSRKRGGVFRYGIHQCKDGRRQLSGWLSPRESMSSEKSTRSWERELFTGWPASKKKPEKGEKTVRRGPTWWSKGRSVSRRRKWEAEWAEGPAGPLVSLQEGCSWPCRAIPVSLHEQGSAAVG